MKTSPTDPRSRTPDSVSRRTFLRATSVASLGLSTFDLSRTAHAAGSDIIRVGMIGCGGRNTGAAVQALAADSGARLVAMCDIFLDRILAKRNEIKKARPTQVLANDDHCFPGFEGYKHVIEASDVVLIANAAKFHPLHAMTAIRAGKHVFVEKPHGIDPAGVALMQETCDIADEKNLCIVSGLHSRYHLGYAETVQRIHDGAIGDILAIEENFLRAPYGVTHRNPALNELQWQLSSQYRFRWLSGDDVVQSLVHNLDRTSWVLGNKVPIKCHGLGGRSSMTARNYGDVFDHHAVAYEFENGVHAYAFCRTTTGCYDEDSSIVIGTKGKASIKACRIWGENHWRWHGQCDPYQVEHDRLFAAIRSGDRLNNGDYMARSTLITVMGQLSCYTGKEITWEQASQSNFYYPPHPAECRDDMQAPTQPGSDDTYPVPIPGQTFFQLRT